MPAAKVWKGNEQLRRLLVPVGSLKPHPKNPRTHSLGTIRESLEAFGQQHPCVALPDGTLVVGHGRWRAAQDLGWTHVAAVKSNLTGDEVERYLLADNRASDRAGYDEAARGALLEDLHRRGKLEGTGYAPVDAQAILAELAERGARAGGGGGAKRPPDAPWGEVVIRLDSDRLQRFHAFVKTLRGEWKLEDASEVIFEAVKREVENR